MGKLLAERDASGALLDEFIATLRRIITSRKEMKNKAVNMHTNARGLYEQARSKVICVRVAEVSELRETFDKYNEYM